MVESTIEETNAKDGKLNNRKSLCLCFEIILNSSEKNR